MPEHVVACAHQRLPLGRERDLVLPVQRGRVLRGVAGDGAVGVVAGGRDGRGGAVAGVENGHAVRAARDGLGALLLLAQFHAHQPLLLQAAQLVAPGHIGLVEEAFFVAQDERARAAHGHVHGVGGATRQGVVAVQRVVVQARDVAHRPVVIEAVVECGSQRLHGAGGGVVLRRVAGAVVGAGGHVHWPAVERGDAEVREALVAGVGVLQQQVGLRGELERERRREVVALDELLVAVAAGVFYGGIDA